MCFPVRSPRSFTVSTKNNCLRLLSMSQMIKLFADQLVEDYWLAVRASCGENTSLGENAYGVTAFGQKREVAFPFA